MKNVLRSYQSKIIFICIVLPLIFLVCKNRPKRFYIPETNISILLEHQDDTIHRIYICNKNEQGADYIDFERPQGRGHQTLFFKSPNTIYVINKDGLKIDTLVSENFKIYNVVDNPNNPTQCPSDCRFNWPKPMKSTVVDLRDSTFLNSDYIILIENNLSEIRVTPTNPNEKYYF